MAAQDNVHKFLSAIEDEAPELEMDLSRESAQAWGQATFPTNGSSVWAILKPASNEELATILTMAQEHQVALYPVSTGKNWGFGSRVPPCRGALAVSLANINEVVGLDLEAGTVTVQPGTTFRQVQKLLAQSKQPWQLSAPSNTPDCSIIGNTLERGLCKGPSLERWKSIIGMEVMLPDGKLFRTDSYVTPQANRGTPAGPDVLPLFVQSNLGLVTEMTLALDRQPNFWRHLHLTWLDEDLSLEEMSQVLRKLLIDGYFPTNITVHNAEKVISYLHRYPSKEKPLAADDRNRLLQEIGGGDWFLETAISAPNQAGLLAMKAGVEEALASLPIKIRWGQQNAPGPMYHYHTEETAKRVYWRKSMELPADIDPDRDQCGVLWFCPVIPWNGPDLIAVSHLVHELAYTRGYEPMVSFLFDNHRYVYAIISILFDRENKEEDAAAMALYKELNVRLTEARYYPYRLGWFDHRFGVDWDFDHVRDELLSHLKNNVDPSGILAPGRYDFYHLY